MRANMVLLSACITLKEVAECMAAFWTYIINSNEAFSPARVITINTAHPHIPVTKSFLPPASLHKGDNSVFCGNILK